MSRLELAPAPNTADELGRPERHDRVLDPKERGPLGFLPFLARFLLGRAGLLAPNAQPIRPESVFDPDLAELVGQVLGKVLPDHSAALREHDVAELGILALERGF
jgi:hypothetical protein